MEETKKDTQLNILRTVMKVLDTEHPEYWEEGTTGRDLMVSIANWIEELENTLYESDSN